MDPDAFAAAGAMAVGFRIDVGNPGPHDAVLDAADADAASPAGMKAIFHRRARFGIGGIEDVILVDIDAAGPAELAPDIDQHAVLAENLDAVVVAVGDIKPALAVHRQRVRDFETPQADALA